MTGVRRRLRSERGAELIELAMALPILMLVVGGIVDFGFTFRAWQVITNAAREGARIGVLPQYSCTPAAGGDVERRVADYMASAGMAGHTVDAGIVQVNGLRSCRVRVSLDQQLPSLGVFAQFFGGNFGTVSLAAGATMRTETQAP
jgi:Flp pilus assembly protein TadG